MFCVVLVCALLAVGCGGSSVLWTRLQKDSGCSRIVNGSPAAKGEFPSQLSLQEREKHICGASILSERWALTAAHCLTHSSVKRLSLLSGTHDFHSGGTVHPVLQVVVHRDYEEYALGNDIAVLKVSVPFDLDGIVRRPITLPEIDRPTAAESVATVIGWGYVSRCLQRPNLLQKVDLLIMNQDACKEFYDFTTPLYSNQICAYSPEEKGACWGDSGSPLFVDGVVVGIVSFGMENCGVIEQPDVFTRVASFVEWIEEATRCVN